jgi:septal ring factor EnvC (AmiA/AmiB activator)
MTDERSEQIYVHVEECPNCGGWPSSCGCKAESPKRERIEPETIDVVLENRTLREQLAANAATIAAQAAATVCAEGIHQQMTAELAAQAAEIERLLDGNAAMLSRNIDLAAELDAAKKELAALRSQLEEQRAKLEATKPNH